VSTRYVICKEDELRPGEMRAKVVGKNQLPVIVVRTGAGSVHAVYGRCSHQGAPLAAGRLVGETVGEPNGEIRCIRDGEILQCPWHAFGYDVNSGRALADPERLRICCFDVTLEGGAVVGTI